MYTEAEIREIGFECLQERLGSVGTERFIASVINDPGDYTLARRRIFDDMTWEEVLEMAEKDRREHPLPEETLKRIEKYKHEHEL